MWKLMAFSLKKEAKTIFKEKVIKECFPEEMYLVIKRVTESNLEDGNVDRIEKNG